MYCTNCGAKLKDGANFCTECGSKVKKSQAKPKKENVDPKDYTKKNVEDKKIEKKNNSNKKEASNESAIINKGKYREFFAGSKDSKINLDDSIKKEDDKKDIEDKKFSKENTENLASSNELSKDYKDKKDINNDLLDKNLEGEKLEKTPSNDINLSLDEKSFDSKEKIQEDPNPLKDDAYTQKLDLSKIDEKKDKSNKEFENKSENSVSNKESKDYKNVVNTKLDEKVTNPKGLIKTVSYIGLGLMAIFAFIYLIDLFAILKSIIGGIFQW